MKKHAFLSLILVTILPHYLLSQDTAFFDYGWLKMMHEGEDFESIFVRGTEAYGEDSLKTKENNFKHYARWQNFWKNRAFSTPEEASSSEKFGQFYHQAKASGSLFNSPICTSNSEYSDWEDWSFNTQPLLNGNNSRWGGMGVMSCVKIDTSDSNLQTIYAGSPIGGLWKTTDQGDNWFNLTDVTKSPSMAIADIDIDPYDNQHLLVATGTFWSNSPPGIGVIESFDGGSTWDTTGLNSYPITSLSPTAYVDFVAFHPTDSNRYFAAAGDSLYLTTNQGVDWDNVILSLPNTNERFIEIQFHPENPDTFYVSSGGTDARIYRTLDGGGNFTDITSNFTSSGNLKNIRIDVVSTHPDSLYATILFNNATAKTYTNSNNGSTNQLTSSISSYYFGHIDKSIFEVSPSDQDIKFFGNIPFARSTNGGVNVTNMRTSMHDDMRGSDCVIGLAAIAHDGGISISTNDGASWAFKSDGLNVQQNWAHDVNEDFTYLVSAMQDIGFYRFDITNKTWKMLAWGEGGRSMISDIDQSVGLVNSYCGASSICDFGVNKYSNYGNSISSSSYVTPMQWHDFSLRPLVEFPNMDVYTGLEDIYTTSNYTSWTKLTDFDGTGFKGNAINDFIIDMDRSDVDTNLMLAAFSLQSWNRDEDNIPCGDPGANCPQKKLLLSRDKGSTWKDITKGTSTGLPIEWFNLSGAIFSPTDPAKIWVIFGGYYESYGSGYNAGTKVYFSPDTGNTWTNISYNLPNFPVNDIVYQENSDDRIYVGTDAGVFTIESDDTLWECYNNNLPPAYVMHLDINNCGGALTASTHGRGIWKSPLAPITLNNNVSWNGNKKIGSDIIVNGVLTISDTVQMAEGTKITVNPGGKLILNGGTLMVSECSEGLWQGIELVGQSNTSQSLTNMGYASFANSAEIRDAKVGLRTGETDENGYIPGTSGSYFNGNTVTFRNNLMDIKMHPYENINPIDSSIISDRSACNNCSFISDEALPNNQITAIHIELDSIVGMEFDGILIDNQLAQSILSERSIGVKAYNTTFFITPFGSTRSEFNTLYRAIDCYTPNLSYIPSIDQADFIDNVQGVRIAGNDYAEVTRSTFEILDNSSYDCYGIYLDYCNAYVIEENEFSYQGGGSASYATGLVVNSSKDDINEIYKNKFDDLIVGALVHGNNQQSGTDYGLVYKCNEFNGNNYHIALNQVSSMFGTINPSVANKQEFTPGNGDGVGNTFEPICISGTEEDFYVDNGGNNINYYHFTDNITTPTCRTISKVTNISVGTSFNSTSTCPSSFASGGGGGPWGPGPSLIRNSSSFWLSQIQHLSISKSGSYSSQRLRNNYVRAQLKKDTIPVDSIVNLLDQYGDSLDQIRKIAILSRLGISSLKSNSTASKLSTEQREYLNFVNEASIGFGRIIDEAINSSSHPYFMWSRAIMYKNKGEDIPAPVNLPFKRIKIQGEDKQELIALNIFPNPADDELILVTEAEGRMQLKLFDLKGSLIKSITLKENVARKRLNVQNLQNGIYILKLFRNGNELGSEKINIQH